MYTEQINPLLLTDGYKLGHRQQYPPNTEYIYSNWTPRGSRISEVDKVVVLGIQYFIEHYLMDAMDDGFFNRCEDEVVAEYKRFVDQYLGGDNDVDHIRELHRLQYLPLRIKALPEGTSCPLRVPMLTIENTKPEFFWLTNYFETLMSCVLWQPMTSATIAKRFKTLLSRHIKKTDPENMWFADWQGHDFSMRGMSGTESAMLSGMGHASSFCGSDTFPMLWFLREYYNTEFNPENVVIGSVPATEHSVMSAGGEKDEIETFRRLLKIYPTGILSVVSDTWNLWDVCTKILPKLKNEIMAREGKLVIRPDSGDPVDIICGDPTKLSDTSVGKGVIELLWDTFGGETTSTGHKRLDSHIGAIYGDSINLDRAEKMLNKLEYKGFAATNVVLGIGSFTYQYNTRDVFGFAMKATNAIIDGVSYPLFKDPVTDDGLKKSAKGLLRVDRNAEGELVVEENVTRDREAGGLLETVFIDGYLNRPQSWKEIEERIANNE